MDFKDFYYLFETITAPLPTTSNELDFDSAFQVIETIAKKAFGPLPADVTGSKHTHWDHNIEHFGFIEVKTADREIGFTVYQKPISYILHNKGSRKVIEMDVEFSWANDPVNRSSKEDHVFPVAQELNAHTLPALRAFKDFFTSLRQYPIIVTFTSITSPRSGAGVKGNLNRRKDLYDRILQATGFKPVKNGVWFSPTMT